MAFEVIPTIDLRGGRCGRPYQGDFARETVFSDDPMGVARGRAREPAHGGGPLLGMALGELGSLDALSEDCAADGVYECMVVSVPLKLPGGIGSPGSGKRKEPGA